MLKNLIQKRADLVAEAQRAFDAAGTENRNMTDAEMARDDAISVELKDLNSQIERAQAQMDRQRTIGLAPNAQGNIQPQGSGFKSFGEMLTAVVASDTNRAHDPRLMQAAGVGMNESVSADGGFLVQTDLITDLLTTIYNSGDILNRVRKIPIGPLSNGLKLKAVDETSRANGSRWGGIQAYWTGEGAPMTASQAKFRQVSLELDKLTGLCYVTDDLLQDSVALEAWMNIAFPEEFVFKLEDAYFNGLGAGMPLGVLNSTCLITVNKEAAQAAATLQPENIVKMWSRMPARMRKNAVWYINQDVEPQLVLMNLKVKNVAGIENVGGIAIPEVVYTPPGFNGNPYATLMGRPIIPVEYCSTLGTAGDIVLCDPSQYLMIDKGGIKQASSIHVRFLTNETAFRFTYRANGQPLWAAPIIPYKGATTQSPFIALQTR